jgi:hypothetical protein
MTKTKTSSTWGKTILHDLALNLARALAKAIAKAII